MIVRLKVSLSKLVICLVLLGNNLAQLSEMTSNTAMSQKKIAQQVGYCYSWWHGANRPGPRMFNLPSAS